MKLVVGLGNPGRRYDGTRHNVGFRVLGELAKRHGTSSPKAKFHGELVEAELAGEKLLLLCPLTYMNQSGLSVQETKAFFRVTDGDLLVVCDDLNLPVAKLRFRSQGSAGGQKGMEDIIRRLGTEAFPRLRIGIGSPPPEWNWADFVLARFTSEEKALVDEAIPRAADAVAVWVREGIERSMNQYN